MEEYTQITIDEWQQWKEDIRRKLQETASNFVYIGFRLKQIRDSGMFDGCESIFEFAKKEYGLERSTVSRFMSINDKFSKHGNSIELRDEFVGLNQSQLSEMLSLPVSDYDLVTEDTSIKDIREIKSFNKEDMNEPEEAPAQTECPQWTPLQKCIIDFFDMNRDLLDEISKMLDEKEIAEAIAPSGSRVHKKGTVLLMMYDYDHGVKYKVMGKPDPESMTWEKFYDEIHKIFFDFPDDYKEHLSEIFPQSVSKVPESVQKEPENVEKPEKIDKKPQKPAKEEKETEAAAGDNDNSGAAGFEEIQKIYSEMFKLTRDIQDALNGRNWQEAYSITVNLRIKIDQMMKCDAVTVSEALDAEFDNE